MLDYESKRVAHESFGKKKKPRKGVHWAYSVCLSQRQKIKDGWSLATRGTNQETRRIRNASSRIT